MHTNRCADASALPSYTEISLISFSPSLVCSSNYTTPFLTPLLIKNLYRLPACSLADTRQLHLSGHTIHHKQSGSVRNREWSAPETRRTELGRAVLGECHFHSAVLRYYRDIIAVAK